METGTILKNLRTERGLTQQELGERLKIGQATIACYESGLREPHISIMIAYADFFECSLDFLAGRTDDMGNVIINEEKTSNGRATLTEDELEFLEKYKLLTPALKIKLEGFIEGLLAAKRN